MYVYIVARLPREIYVHCIALTPSFPRCLIQWCRALGRSARVIELCILCWLKSPSTRPRRRGSWQLQGRGAPPAPSTRRGSRYSGSLGSPGACGAPQASCSRSSLGRSSRRSARRQRKLPVLVEVHPIFYVYFGGSGRGALFLLLLLEGI